jgi:DNA-binding GntR family transcriptional regulator
MGELEFEGAVKTPKTIAEQVYDLLKKKILYHEIMPGERLLEIALCESLSVSRTPVREAFRLLQQDGLVERIPQGGVQVTDISLEDLVEISALRTVLEVYAGELACDKITEKEIEKLEGLMHKTAEMIVAERDGKNIDVAEFSALNTAFHDIVCDAAQSTYLSKILETVRLPILRFRPVSLEDKTHRTRGWEEHKNMIKMLKARDKEGLKKLIAKHVSDVGEAVAKTLASKKAD